MASDLLVHLRSCYPALANALEPVPRETLEAVLKAPRYYVDHPLKWLLLGIQRPGSLQAEILANTGRAYETAIRNGGLNTWLSARIKEACIVPQVVNREAAYSELAPVYKALSEIRALGYLMICNLEVEPRSHGGADFSVPGPTGEEARVEVSAMRMAEESAAELVQERQNRCPFGHEAAVYPGGTPKRGELTVDNVVHRFSQKAQSKNEQLPADKPSLLWIDLQFEDWWSLHPDEAWPLYVTNRGRFHTGGVWLAFYGRQGIPLLDSESIQNGVPPATRGIEHTSLRYPGYFQSKDARASAVVISWPSSTVLFENPWAPNPLPRPILERLLHLRWFDWPRSWVRPFWKEPTAGLTDLLARVCSALDEITDISQIAQLDW